MNTDLAWAIRDGIAAAPCTCDWTICDRCDMLRRLAHLQHQDALEREQRSAPASARHHDASSGQ